MVTASLSKGRKRRSSGKGCHRKRMGSAGMRCFCNGKLVRSSRCK